MPSGSGNSSPQGEEFAPQSDMGEGEYADDFNEAGFDNNDVEFGGAELGDASSGHAEIQDADLDFDPAKLMAAGDPPDVLAFPQAGTEPEPTFPSDGFPENSFAQDNVPFGDAFPGSPDWNAADDAWLQALTPSQLEAVTHVDGPLLILAGPGSGKTRVVSHRITYLLRQGIPAEQILALTFTNKAADELRLRVDSLMPGERVWTSTFHRLCAKLLRRYAQHVGLDANFTIYDTGDSLRTLKRVMGRDSQRWERFTADQISKAISWAKNNLIRADEYKPQGGSPLGAVTAEIYPEYQAELISANAVDFDDLLLHIASTLKDNAEIRQELDVAFRYVLVDEYQDTNLAQYAIVRSLNIDYPNLAVTGDPDQSIYGWRGANIKNILEFEHDYPSVRVVRLEQNYRSTQRILSVADALIRHNVRRKQKALYTSNQAGQPVRYVAYNDERDEAESIVTTIAQAVRDGRRRPRDFAIFYRVNALSRAFEHALRDQGVPYQIVNGVEFYQRKEIKDVLGYLALLNNPRDNEAFLRVINTPTRGIGKATLGRLDEFANSQRITLLEGARQASQVLGLNARAVKRLRQFVELFESLERVVHQPVEEIVGYVLEQTDLREIYARSEAEEDQQRAANIDELLTAARQFDERHAGQDYLEGFLEDSSLINDIDAWAEESDQVTLMTLHASKGLEFPSVFIIAVENGLIPHERSQHNPDFEEEERRLLFVGMTRAEEELQISMARRRSFRGRTGMSVPSNFTLELPREEMDWDQPSLTSVPTEDRPRRSTVETVPFDTGTGILQTAAQLAPQNENSTALPTANEQGETPWGETGAAAERLPAVSSDAFARGMVVSHPEYGLGKVIALSGEGERRQATVAFASAAGERKFVLAKSKLKIMKRS
ncbi:MAG: UvrD-helicase domain-containing protein [Pirellulales bacterium]|nr:UvrD-helicase domain-containing protein [Pirellulales bacterium]